jgi:hypothetical protein
MREAQGTWVGAALDDNRLSVSGWVTTSYNASSAAQNNQPLTWNDRANELLLQQTYLRIARTLATTGTTEPTFGFQVDLNYGSDYRFTLPRGFFNAQLLNADGNPNVYGFDSPQHYLSAYGSGLFNGVEFRVGRFFSPFGYESNESVSTPLISRAYSFTSSPFTMCGGGAYVTFDPRWSAALLLVNGNDVYFGYPAEELRVAGNVKYTDPSQRDTVQLGYSLGRGKFNAGAPFPTPTPATSTEPLGRNNLDYVELFWTHKFSDRLNYTAFTRYGTQSNVPGLPTPTRVGTANDVGLVHYLSATLSPQWTAIGRLENFWDFQGQRTGFEGLYTAATVDLVYWPTRDLRLRAEARYDYNAESRPYEGKHDLFTAAVDLTLRF